MNNIFSSATPKFGFLSNTARAYPIGMPEPYNAWQVGEEPPVEGHLAEVILKAALQHPGTDVFTVRTAPLQAVEDVPRPREPLTVRVRIEDVSPKAARELLAPEKVWDWLSGGRNFSNATGLPNVTAVGYEDGVLTTTLNYVA